MLMRGELPAGYGSGPGRCSRSKLFDRYIRHASKQGVRRRSIEVQIGIFLGKNVPDLKKTETTISRKGGLYSAEGNTEEKILTYSLPDLATCRKAFSERLTQDVDWVEKDDWSIESEEPM